MSISRTRKSEHAYSSPCTLDLARDMDGPASTLPPAETERGGDSPDGPRKPGAARPRVELTFPPARSRRTALADAFAAWLALFGLRKT